MVHSWHCISVSVVNKYLVIHPTIHSQILKKSFGCNRYLFDLWFMFVYLYICKIKKKNNYRSNICIIPNGKLSVKIIFWWFFTLLFYETKKRFKSKKKKKKTDATFFIIPSLGTIPMWWVYYITKNGKCLVKIFSLFQPTSHFLLFGFWFYYSNNNN